MQRKAFAVVITVCVFVTQINLYVSADVNCGDWKKFGDEKCFRAFSEAGSYEKANSFCSQSKSSLITIKSLEEQKFLENFIFKQNGVVNSVWLGMKYNNLTKRFQWHDDDSELKYVNWAQGFPNYNKQPSCVEMEVQDENQGKWANRPCGRMNGIVCEKKQEWTMERVKEKIMKLEKENRELKNNLESTGNQLKQAKEEIKKSSNERDKLKNDLSKTNSQVDNFNNQLKQAKEEIKKNANGMDKLRTDLNKTNTQVETFNNQLDKKMNQRLEYVEGAFKTSFEVKGDKNFYYPVAFLLPHYQMWPYKNYESTPMLYEIYRAMDEKAPPEWDPWGKHYMSLSLKVLAYGGTWGGNVDEAKVLFHFWKYNKGVAKLHLFQECERRLYIWLRGGGVLYHMRSPVNLSDHSDKITIYYQNMTGKKLPCFWGDSKNPGTCPAPDSHQIIPIPVGQEDPNLVKQKQYDGWPF